MPKIKLLIEVELIDNMDKRYCLGCQLSTCKGVDIICLAFNEKLAFNNGFLRCENCLKNEVRKLNSLIKIRRKIK